MCCTGAACVLNAEIERVVLAFVASILDVVRVGGAKVNIKMRLASVVLINEVAILAARTIIFVSFGKPHNIQWCLAHTCSVPSRSSTR